MSVSRAKAAVMIVLWLLFFSINVSAEEIVTTTGENETGEVTGYTLALSNELDASRLFKEKIDALIEENKETTPSVSISVFDDKADIYSVVYGYADMENKVKADENTVYEWGSVSKLLVWTSAMQLYEQGKLELDKDIREYLPKDFFKNLKYDEPLTMLDLMNHSSGYISPFKDMETPELSQLMELDKALQEIEPAQAYAPGKVTAYSNFGAALAGYVVECVSGMKYSEYVNKNIFERLGMEHTAICPDLSDNSFVAEQRKKTHCYFMGENGLEPLGECRRYIHIYPAGSACGTISDMAVFAKAFLQDSKDCTLFDKDDTLDTMLSASMYFADGKTKRFCHGLMVENAGVQLLGHGGKTEGFSSLLQFDRESRTGYVMMINLQMDYKYSSKLPVSIYGDYVADKKEDFSKLDLSGHYILTGGIAEEGCLSLYGFLTDRLRIEKNGDKYATPDRGVLEYEQIADNKIISKLINGHDVLYFIRLNDKGEIEALENDSLDFIKMSEAEYYGRMSVLILLAVSMGFAAVMTLIHALRLKKYKGQEVFGFKRTQLVTETMVVMMAIPMYLLFKGGYWFDVFRMICCLAIIALSLILVCLTVVTIKKSLKNGFGVSIVVESVCNLLVVFGVIFWKMYQFWGI